MTQQVITSHYIKIHCHYIKIKLCDKNRRYEKYTIRETCSLKIHFITVFLAGNCIFKNNDVMLILTTFV